MIAFIWIAPSRGPPAWGSLAGSSASSTGAGAERLTMPSFEGSVFPPLHPASAPAALTAPTSTRLSATERPLVEALPSAPERGVDSLCG